MTDHLPENSSASSAAPAPASPSLQVTSDAYDAVATLYADLARDSIDSLPLDRSFIAAFADCVRDAGGGAVGELGCGPGQLTAHLRGLGLDAFGVDLSPVMIGLAREAYPGVRFETGSMDALDLPDGGLSGVVSWYSVIHAVPADVAVYVREFHRVLAPGGHLLLGFFESEGAPVTAFDHKVTTAYRWPLDELAATVRDSGFDEVGRMLREPGEDERFRRGHLLMRRR